MRLDLFLNVISSSIYKVKNKMFSLKVGLEVEMDGFLCDCSYLAMTVDVDSHIYEGFSFNYNFHCPVRKFFEKDYHSNSILSFCTWSFQPG